MKTTKKISGIKVNSGVKAGGFDPVPRGTSGGNHNRNLLRVKADIKAGTVVQSNHNRSALRIKAGIKAGTVVLLANHNRRLLEVA
jgi:hypothetical protein